MPHLTRLFMLAMDGLHHSCMQIVMTSVLIQHALETRACSTHHWHRLAQRKTALQEAGRKARHLELG